MKPEILVLGVFVGTIVAASFRDIDTSDYLTLLEIVILSFTAWVVYNYTQETKRLRKTTELQTQFSVEPFLSLEEFEGMVALVNKSGGVARNIVISSSENPGQFDFVHVEALAPSERKKIEFRTGPHSKEFLAPHEVQNWLMIHYDNMLRQRKFIKFRRADYGHGFTEEDRDACGTIPDWALKKYFGVENKNV